jgi:hypothetical protein
MKNFKLNFHGLAKESTRKHQSALVKDLSQNSLDVICRHNLKSLKVESNFKLSDLVKALRNLPDLKCLNASSTTYIDDVSNADYFVKVQTNLLQLACHVDMIYIFDCSSLRKLKLTFKYSRNYNRMLVDFLFQQNDLQELALDSVNDDIFALDDIFQLKLSLKSLRIYCFERHFQFHDNLSKFLLLQKDSLTSLQLAAFSEPDLGIEFVLKNLKKMKYLELSRYYYRDKISFNNLTPENHTAKNIESLEFNIMNFNLSEAKEFFNLFLNLKNLSLYKDFSDNFELLLHISNTNTKLEILIVNHMTNDFCHIYFPNLKEFCAKNWVVSDGCLRSFINKHSGTLEKLSLRGNDIYTESVAKEIMNCKKLTSLVIVNFSKHLHHLKWIYDISLRALSFTLTIGFYRVIETFKFPDDKAIWDEKFEAWRANDYNKI